MKETKGYSINDNYTCVTVYFFENEVLTGTLKITPDKGMTRRQRYDALVKDLACAKITPAAFNTKGRGK